MPPEQVEMFEEPLRSVKGWQRWRAKQKEELGMSTQVEMFLNEALTGFKEELYRKLREVMGVPDTTAFDIQTACEMISSLKETIDILQKARTSELNARGDLAAMLTGNWDETIPWVKLFDKVSKLMIKANESSTSGAFEEVPYAYLPVWADVVHLMNHSMWPGADIPMWASERARRWKCSARDIKILMHAANYEIERLQKLVEITNEERDEAIQKSNRLEGLISNCIICLDDARDRISGIRSTFDIVSEVKDKFDSVNGVREIKDREFLQHVKAAIQK